MRKTVHSLLISTVFFGFCCGSGKAQDRAGELDAASAQTPDSGSQRTQPTKPCIRRFLLVGDSHAVNLQNELRYKIGSDRYGFDHLSAIGTRAVGWIKSGKLKQRLKEYDPDVVLVSFGTNEAKFDTSPSKLAAQFQEFVDQISDHGRRCIIWLVPPALTGVSYLANVREALQMVKGIEVIDLSEHTYGARPDNIHLTRAAYRFWTWDIWDEVRRRLAL